MSMKGIETGKDKVKKICEVLKKETLEPAMHEAEEIIAAAKQKAEEIVQEALQQAALMKREAAEAIAKEKNVFESSLNQACKQSVAELKQRIEYQVLDEQLFSALSKEMGQPEVLSNLIKAVIEAIEKEGLDTHLSAYIPSVVPARAVNELLGKELLSKLQEKSVLIGSGAGGVQIVLHENKMTIDLSDKTLKELVAGFIRKDFREMIFGGV